MFSLICFKLPASIVRFWVFISMIATFYLPFLSILTTSFFNRFSGESEARGYATRGQ